MQQLTPSALNSHKRLPLCRLAVAPGIDLAVVRCPRAQARVTVTLAKIISVCVHQCLRAATGSLRPLRCDLDWLRVPGPGPPQECEIHILPKRAQSPTVTPRAAPLALGQRPPPFTTDRTACRRRRRASGASRCGQCPAECRPGRSIKRARSLI